MNKFSPVNSWILKLTSNQLQNFFEELVKTHPNGFTIYDLRNIPSFIAFDIRGWKVSEFGTVLSQRFKLMGLTKYVKGKWIYEDCVDIPVVLPTVEKTVKLMRELEDILVEMGYSKTESAVFEKTEVVSITI